MDNTMVLNAGFNELVFENRHKKYGAYEIRRRYRRNVILSGLLATSIFAAGMILYVMNPPVALAKDPPKPDIEEVPVFTEPQKRDEPKILEPRPNPIPVAKGPDVKMPTVPVVTLDSVPATNPNDSAGRHPKGDPNGVVGNPNPPCVNCNGDTTGTTPPPPKPPVTWSPFPPTCKGLDEFFQNNIRYPQAAKDANIEGTVWLEFIVDSKGNVSEIKIAKGVHPLLDREVMRVAPKMPAWEGGKDDNGEPVDFLFRKPVRFELSK